MNTQTTIQTSSDQSELDVTAAVADISADLFRQGEDGEKGDKGSAAVGSEKAPDKPLESVEAAPTPRPENEAETAEGNSQQVQETGAPKTWSKEAIAEWATISPRAQQEILKREEDMLRGLAGYKDRAELGDRYDGVVGPFKPLLQAENIDPVQLFQSFASNHYLLSRGTEAQKLELAANLISGYGIDFGKLADFIGDRMAMDPEILRLRQENQELRNGQTARQQQETTAIQSRLNTEIEAFAADPKNIYFPDLVDDIVKIFEAGQATTLQEAYEKAIYLNPTTRQKEIERLTAEKSNSASAEEAARKAKIAAATATDLSLDPKARNGTVALGSIDDTLNETMARIASRG